MWTSRLLMLKLVQVAYISTAYAFLNGAAWLDRHMGKMSGVH